MSELKQSLAMALDHGISLELNAWHLYRTNYGDGAYVLLKFDDRVEIDEETEERFPLDADGRSDAVAKFLRKTSK